MALPAAAFAIPGIVKGGLGLFQLLKGSQMDPQRPTYEIPDEVKESLAAARRMERGRMPGIERAEERVRQGEATSAYGLRRAATNPNQILSGLAGVRAQAKIAERGLLESEAQDYYRRLGNLQRSLGLMAQYKDKQFEINEMQPYQDEARTKAALTQSGLLNTFGGLRGAISDTAMAENYLGAEGFGEFSDRMFGMSPFGQYNADEMKEKGYEFVNGAWRKKN